MSVLTFTDGVQASLGTWDDPSGDYQAYNAAFSAQFEQVWSIVADQGSPDEPETYTAGWSTLLDPLTTPYPAFLGLFVGVYVPPGTSRAAAESLLIAEQGFNRGTSASVVAAAQQNLSAPQTCTLIERTGPSGPDAYHFLLIVNPTQVVSSSALTAAVNATKPAGIQWTLVSTVGWTIAQMEASYGTVDALESAFVTLNGLENDLTGD